MYIIRTPDIQEQWHQHLIGSTEHAIIKFCLLEMHISGRSLSWDADVQYIDSIVKTVTASSFILNQKYSTLIPW